MCLQISECHGATPQEMIIDVSELKTDALNREDMGGKAYSLARLAIAGVKIPRTFLVPAQTYRDYTANTGICDRMMVELSRKDFSEMRWEEMWDAALRIRNLFIKTPIPENLKQELLAQLYDRFPNCPVVVRSSALWEDGSNASFAGLHESFVNVVGPASLLDHIKLVWASLWSDRALMYRNELGLEAHSSAMAVVIQELVAGEKSGVIFTKSPDDNPHSIIECVYGLNQGLVDGAISPDRWIFSNETGSVIEFHPAQRSEYLKAIDGGGLQKTSLSPRQILTPPLNDIELTDVYNLGKFCESIFKRPQDVEWTFRLKDLIALQSRPVTALKDDSTDQRIWYRSLVRSFENLKQLRQTISSELIPGMIQAADGLSDESLKLMSDSDLSREIVRRIEINEKWTGVYWRYFIPFAHGIRLFGQFYNDSVKPDDPYEFMSLLRQTSMLSLERNRTLRDLAKNLTDRSNDPTRKTSIEINPESLGGPWFEWLSRFIDNDRVSPALQTFLEQFKNIQERPIGTEQKPTEKIMDDFLGMFEGEALDQARDLLDLARYSYQLRDDDNIYLGRIESKLQSAVTLAVERLLASGYVGAKGLKPDQVARALVDHSYRPDPETKADEKTHDLFTSKVRQLRGQPAGPGFASGIARVINSPEDLLDFKANEVLVCDAIDPNMTFVVPLCSAIVERRGGMLIHGAIIAREYGLPCVTGVPEASSLIKNGDRVSVDGYLGLVTVG